MIGLLQRIAYRRAFLWTTCWLTMVALGGCTDSASTSPGVAVLPPLQEIPIPSAPYFPTPTVTPSTPPTPVILTGPVTVALPSDLPEEYAGPLLAALTRMGEITASNGSFPLLVLDQVENATTRIEFVPWREGSYHLAERFYAVVAPFETIADDITLEELQLRWQGRKDGTIFTTGAAKEVVSTVLGPSKAQEVSAARLLQRLEENPDALGIVPFDELDPRLKVLTIDGTSILDREMDPATYPLSVALSIHGEAASLLAHELDAVIQPDTNRQAERLTTLIMTGVTAISRGTAAAIERNSLTYPAEIISATLRAADITHVSNEVPFLDDCVVNNTENNLVLCSHTDYWATLEAIGADIVGLSGNHVNDFGREGARRSLQYYRDNEIPIYGSGLDVDEACQPLLWEDHGTTFAFVAVLAFGPPTAWATEDEPGACYYYEQKEAVLATVEELARQVDIVSVELQYLEIYDPVPTNQQVVEFRELRRAGADIVTGVQSHVPQAAEPYGTGDRGGPGVIMYGLGNLFFDQMWSWATRTELIARHTIYDGRLLNTEILTTVLEDFAQPRWAEQEERSEILSRIFTAAPFRPPPEEN